MARTLLAYPLDVRTASMRSAHHRSVVADSSHYADNDSVEGMAFPPDYRPRGPPPAPQGKPLLNLSDQEQLDGFFAGFDSNSLTSNSLSTSGPNVMSGDVIASNEQPLTPQYFISSHTHMQGQPPFVDPNALEGSSNMFNSAHVGSNVPMAVNAGPYNQMIQHTAHALPFANYQTPHNSGHDFFDPLATSMSTAYSVPWPHTLSLNNPLPAGSRPLVRFGSDSHFGPSGYVPPLGSAELSDQSGMQRFEWLEGDAQSSAPNTQPNTQPPSPVWTRKRKADTDQSTRSSRSNDLVENAEPAEQEEKQMDTNTASPWKRRKGTLKAESDAPFQPSQSHSSTTIKPNTREKRKSFVATPISPPQSFPTAAAPSPSATKPKRPPAISSISGSGIRVPLTSDQKRANHTNSEQRRRDQAQRAFARLFDLVPELEQEGKLSQMKKLERVVSKIRELEEGNEECRRRIGMMDKGGG